MPLLTLDVFQNEFDTAVAVGKETWEVFGFHGSNGKVYPFGTDSKVLSTVFESLAAPLIVEIASRFGYTVESAPQTIYPDFTLTPPGMEMNRIAVDVKTTYRRKSSRFVYTLGSYTSFIRNGTKNILYPYTEYSQHWILGFAYSRSSGVASKSHTGDAPTSSLSCPYEDVDYFIQEKFRIGGVRPASGNTTNIGSLISPDFEDFRQGRGPFAELGPEVFEEYWRHYTPGEGRTYASIQEFLNWMKE